MGQSGIKTYDWGNTFGFKSSVMGRIDDFVPDTAGFTTKEVDQYGVVAWITDELICWVSLSSQDTVDAA